MIAPKICPVHPKITKKRRLFIPIYGGMPRRGYFLKCTEIPVEKLKKFFMLKNARDVYDVVSFK